MDWSGFFAIFINNIWLVVQQAHRSCRMLIKKTTKILVKYTN